MPECLWLLAAEFGIEGGPRFTRASYNLSKSDLVVHQKIFFNPNRPEVLVTSLLALTKYVSSISPEGEVQSEDCPNLKDLVMGARAVGKHNGVAL